MELIRFLLARSRSTVILAVLFGFISGALNSSLLAVVNLAISQKSRITLSLVLAFVGLTILAPLARVFSELLLITLGQNAILALRTELSEQTLNVPLRRLEEVGAHRILSVLTDDIPNITNMIAIIPVLCINCGLVISCFAYMGWLEWRLLLIVLAAVSVGTLAYAFGRGYAVKHLRNARKYENDLQKHFQGLVRGIKELKLHKLRRQAFLKTSVQQTARNVRSENISGIKIYAIVSSWGQLLVFITIGIVVFMLVAGAVPNSVVVTGFALALLYAMTPLQVIMNSVSGFTRANIAIGNIQNMGLNLSRAALPEENAIELTERHDLARIDLVGVTYAYRQEGSGSEFTLGPINLTIHAGELLFIAGGNGSGKTTLAKLITGLYTPEAGAILYGGQPIMQEGQDYYRQLFSAVFSDFFLFECLLGLHEPEVEERAREYLSKLQLDSKVAIKDGFFSTTELSQGQRKRLALLTACLENRPIYFFDEWAADQDPVFKRFFYLNILPGLKASGKTVIVISHDERYYDVADRLIVLESGQLTATVPDFSIKTAIS